MTSDKKRPRVTPQGERAAEARKRRLAEQLRANLGKRKAQARARGKDEAARAEDDTGPPTGKGDSA